MFENDQLEGRRKILSLRISKKINESVKTLGVSSQKESLKVTNENIGDTLEL